MALKLIGAVGVKVRPEAEDFRDEAERQLRRQLKDGYDIPAEIKPELNREKLKQELEKHKQQMRRDLEGMTKNLQIYIPEVQSGKFTQSTQKILKEHKRVNDELQKITEKSVEERLKAEARFYDTSFSSTSGLKGRRAIVAAAEEFRKAAEQVSLAWENTDRAAASSIRRYVAMLNQARDALGQVHDRNKVIENANFEKPARALRQLAHEGDQVSSIYESVSKAVREVGINGAAKKLNIDTNLIKAWKDVQLFRHEWDKIPPEQQKALAVKLQLEDNEVLEEQENRFQDFASRLGDLTTHELQSALEHAVSDRHMGAVEREMDRRLESLARRISGWEKKNSVEVEAKIDNDRIDQQLRKMKKAFAEAGKQSGVQLKDAMKTGINDAFDSTTGLMIGHSREQIEAAGKEIEQRLREIGARQSGWITKNFEGVLQETENKHIDATSRNWQRAVSDAAKASAVQLKKIIKTGVNETFDEVTGEMIGYTREQFQAAEEELERRMDRVKRLRAGWETTTDAATRQRLDNERIERDYQQHVQALEKMAQNRQDLERESAEARIALHKSEMDQIRKDSENLWGGLNYGVKQSIADVRRQIRSLDGKNVLGFDLDLDNFRGRLNRVKAMFNRATEDMDDTEVDIKPVLDESAHRIAWVRLKTLARDRIATIYVHVNGASRRLAANALKSIYGMSGLRSGVNLIKNFGRYMRDLDKHIPALGMIGTAAVSAVSGVAALVGSVAHLANELVRMSGAALALPGILGGFAVGIGVMVVALKDFKKQMPEITSDLNDLGGAIKSNFWQEARAPMLEAWNKAFPHFKRGVEETATSLGKWTAAFSKAFGQHFDMGAFDKMFGNLNKSIDIASLGVDDFVKSLSILGQTGSEYLPKLASWANEVNAGFAGWLENAQKTGQLNDIIDTGVQKLKEFGKLVRETGEFIYILGSAAERAGFSGFGEMANGMERFNEALKSAEGQEVLDDIFEGAAKISDGFKRALGAVGDFVWNSSDLLNDLSGIVGDMVGDTFEDFFKAFERPDFQNGLRDFFQGFSDGVGEISARAPEISDLLGSVGTLAGAVAENMGKVIGKLLETFGPEISDALSDIAPDMEKVGDSISSMMDHLDNAGFDDFVGDIIRLAGANLAVIADDLDGIAMGMEAISKFNEGDFEGLDKLNKEAGEKAGKRVEEDRITGLEGVPVIGGFFSWLNDIGAWIADAIVNVGGWIARLNVGIWEAISGVDWGGMWDGAMDGISAAWDGFIGWLQDVFNFDGNFALDDWWPSIVAWWDEQIAEIVDMFNTAKDWVSDVWTDFTEWLSDLFSGNSASGDLAENQGTTSLLDGFGIDGLGEEFGRRIDLARDWIQDKWAEFKGWLGGLFGGGEGESKFEIVMDIIMGAIDNASGVISGVVNFARDWVANKWQGVLTALDNARTTISRVKDQALNWARGKYQGVLTALDNARTTINRVKDQALNWARGKYRGILTALDNAKGTIASAKSKAQNFASGKYNAVLRALDQASSIVSGVQRKINALKGKTVNIVTNLITKVKKIFSADGNFMPEVKKFADGGIEKHIAQIAPAGAMRVWAEPETGGEAYIPLAKSKRTRSEQILATVADKFGMRLERYANGSDPSGSRQINTASGDTYNIEMNNVPMNHSEEVASELMFNLKHLKRGGGAGAFA